MAKKSAKSKGYRKQVAKKPYLSKKEIGIVYLIAVLLAVGAFFLFRYDDGALKVQDGAVVTDGDNWLIADGSNVRGRARYFKLGEIGEIDGYTREKSGLAADANLPEYTFTPAEGSATVTVTCGHSSAEAMAKYARSTLEAIDATTVGEIQSAELGGQAVRWYSYATDYSAPDDAEAVEADETDATEDGSEAETDADEATEGETDADAEGESYRRSVAGYIDASHDCCVIINAVSKGDAEADCLDDDALLAIVEQAAQAIALDGQA